MWNYVFFLIHLESKDHSDMNGVESSIAELHDNGELSWFPLLRCLRVMKDQKKRFESASENSLEELQKKMQVRYSQSDESLKNIESLLA